MMLEAIGIDYDGTISDTNKMRALWIRENLGIIIEPWNTDETTLLNIIGEDAHKKMDAVVYEREWTLKTPPIDGVISSVRELSKRYVLYVVTKRRPSRVEFAKETLQQYGILDSFIAVISASPAEGIKMSKEDVCRRYNMGALIDDDMVHLRDANSGIRRILMKNGCDDIYACQFKHDGVELTRSWDEILIKFA